MLNLTHTVILLLAAFAGGAMNSLAGGGTLLTFPSLLATGISVTFANGTSTIALLPGSFSSWRAYRHEIHRDRHLLVWLGIPSVLGGAVGAWLVLIAGDKTFAILVPWLILGATALFIVQGPIRHWLQVRSERAPQDDADWNPSLGRLGLFGVLIFQFFVALYGGFFGAGIGILMLSALGILGLTNIHRMNGLKNFAATCINAVAAVTFVVGGKVRWDIALPMAVAAILGGITSARVAQRIPQAYVRRAVVVIGLLIAASQFWKQYGPHS